MTPLFACLSMLLTPNNGMRAVPHTHTCFVCGESNPIGFKLRLETDGRVVQTRLIPRSEHTGFKGTVHGGLVSTVLDEIMAWACAVQTKRFAFCAELNVRFLLPVRPGIEILALGEVVANRRDKLFETKSEIQDLNGMRLATATGKYLPVRKGELVELASELIGDAGFLSETGG
jgi:uncharacterized protein (TIGR00369 family)